MLGILLRLKVAIKIQMNQLSKININGSIYNIDSTLHPIILKSPTLYNGFTLGGNHYAVIYGKLLIITFDIVIPELSGTNKVKNLDCFKYTDLPSKPIYPSRIPLTYHTALSDHHSTAFIYPSDSELGKFILRVNSNEKGATYTGSAVYTLT